jgi:hypothetical protein
LFAHFKMVHIEPLVRTVYDCATSAFAPHVVLSTPLLQRLNQVKDSPHIDYSCSTVTGRILKTKVAAHAAQRLASNHNFLATQARGMFSTALM